MAKALLASYLVARLVGMRLASGEQQPFALPPHAGGNRGPSEAPSGSLPTFHLFAFGNGRAYPASPEQASPTLSPMREQERNTSVMSRLGLRISQIRAIRGFSQRRFADMIELDRATLSRIESGIGNPTMETLERIAEGLEVDVADLFSSEPL